MVITYVRFLLCLRKVEDQLAECEIDMCHEDRTELVEQGWSIIALAREN